MNRVISRFVFLFCRAFLSKGSLICALLILARGARGAEPATVRFDRDVRKILSENCFKCHGPDEKERKGGKKGARLRLDTPDGAQMDLGGRSCRGIPRRASW
jgi:hypothetical protein